MRRLPLWFVTCVLCAAAVQAAEAPAGSDEPEFSVLTPALYGRFTVASGLDGTVFLPYVSGAIEGASDYALRGQSERLRRLVAAEKYDAARTLGDRLVQALAEAGYGAVFEPIARRHAGAIQSLSWSDLPESPKGRLLLDVTVRTICLCRDDFQRSFVPTLSVDWRVLDPRQTVVVEPTRTLVYMHSPGWGIEKPSSTRTVKAPPKEPPYPPAVVSESCAYDNADAALENSARLFGCFGEAYDVAARRLVLDLERARMKHRPVTASGDSPSGTSTR